MIRAGCMHANAYVLPRAIIDCSASVHGRLTLQSWDSHSTC